MNTGQITVTHWIQKIFYGKTNEQPSGLIGLKSVAESKGKSKGYVAISKMQMCRCDNWQNVYATADANPNPNPTDPKHPHICICHIRRLHS